MNECVNKKWIFVIEQRKEVEVKYESRIKMQQVQKKRQQNKPTKLAGSQGNTLREHM